ncbi:MAG: hypothetical protein HFJ45_05155 [Clostridia bacterium]|nr:hypothetical protein [Clostridia bacterium]
MRKEYVTMNSISKKIIIIFMIFLLFFKYVTCGAYLSEDTTYVWSESTVETSTTQSDSNSDFLDLSCESAILIEQTTRNSFI